MFYLWFLFVCALVCLPLLPTFFHRIFCVLVFLRLYFFDIWFLFVCAFGLPLSPSHLFYLQNIFDCLKSISFFWTPCFATHMFDPCFVAASFGTLHFFTG